VADELTTFWTKKTRESRESFGRATLKRMAAKVKIPRIIESRVGSFRIPKIHLLG
jgi:hypothetical protein